MAVAVRRRGSLPLSQADKHHTSTRLVPPYNGCYEGADEQPAERPQEQIQVSRMRLIGVEDAEQDQAHGGGQPRYEGDETGTLPPPRVFCEAVELGRVANMVDGEGGAEEAYPGRGAADDEDGLKGRGADIADERHVWVDLAWIPRPTER